jgi:hypothetical protein
LDLLVRIDEFETELSRERFAHSGFTGTHRSD